MNIDIDLLIIEKIEREQRQRQGEEDSRRLWLPVPEPELKPQTEERREPKRVIEIQL
tara:strand:+ start:219 stop:389 length:171 start_codon:yes stop_codon:yes gene_type:complete